eukprot:m.195210 g.195210  ORF g.195210 m.195210 type:complete len:814 (+) comp17632_c4_seq9:172-2613(+)
MARLGITLALVLLVAVAAVSALPSGILREKKFNDNDLTKFRFLPDGRLLIARRDGKFYLVTDTSQSPMSSTLLFTYNNVDYSGERGLMSFVLDPNFSSNGYFYVMASTITPQNGFNAGMSIIRFTFTASNIAGSAKTLFSDPDGYVDLYHYGGDMVIRNNQIYMSSGDKYFAENAQDSKKAATCIFRINLDGSIPSDNNTPKGSKACWSWGIRNGWRMSYDSPTDRIYIGEVGGNDEAIAMEDIHIAKAGVNYGWPFCEGYCTNPNYISTCDCNKYDNAFYTYAHNGANMAIILGYVNRGNHFPSTYKNGLFFGDYTQGWIKYLPLDTNGNIIGQPILFDDFSLGIINMEMAPDGSLWYSSVYGIDRLYNNNAGGNTNNPPVITQASASYPNGQTGVPLQVKFTGAATDADGNALTYTWDFGDGTTSTAQSPTKTYATSGQYSALLRVSDGQATTASSSILIKVGTAPIVTISSPANNYAFVANQTITLVGSATSGGSPLSASQLVWNIVMFHDDHTHPFLTNNPGTSVSFTTTASGHSTSGNVYLIATLTATNAAGISSSATINIVPQEVNINLNSVPAGVALTLDALPKAAPFTYDTNVGFNHNLGAPSTACINGKTYNFASWSDGGAQTHTVIVPNTNVAFTATYTATTANCGVVTASCANYGCGTYKAGNLCQCDAACATFGNCCSDRASLCVATTNAPATTAAPGTTKAPTTNAPTTQGSTGSCAAYGCGTYKSSNPCQCDSACVNYGDCCADRASLCAATTQAPTTQAPTTGSCAVYGCVYKAANKCQCDKNCASYGDCCSDYSSKC